MHRRVVAAQTVRRRGVPHPRQIDRRQRRRRGPDARRRPVRHAGSHGRATSCRHSRIGRRRHAARRQRCLATLLPAAAMDCRLRRSSLRRRSPNSPPQGRQCRRPALQPAQLDACRHRCSCLDHFGAPDVIAARATHFSTRHRRRVGDFVGRLALRTLNDHEAPPELTVFGPNSSAKNAPNKTKRLPCESLS